MTVFKTFLKVLNKYKTTVILYTVILVFFGGFNMQTSEQSTNFVSTKPDVAIVNYDVEEGITKELIQYLKKNNHIVNLKNDEEVLNDALFYRDVNYIIYIPKNFRMDFLEGKNPTISTKSTNDYQATLASMTLNRYLKVARTYQSIYKEEKELIEKVNHTLDEQVKVSVTSSLDTKDLSRATYYFNFTNYCMLAGCVYIISFILSSFKAESISKRTMISSMNYKTYNRKLLLSNSLFAIILWSIYILLSFVLVGNIMFTVHGLIYVINSFIFMFCSLTIAFLIGNIMRSKDAINGIVNVIALGSSFLCGAFVPMEYLPDFVLKIAHVLPSYYFILSNELISKLEEVNLNTLTPILTNMVIMIGFILLFVMIINGISRKNQKIG